MRDENNLFENYSFLEMLQEASKEPTKDFVSDIDGVSFSMNRGFETVTKQEVKLSDLENSRWTRLVYTIFDLKFCIHHIRPRP